MTEREDVCEGIATYCLAKGDLVVPSEDCPKCNYCKTDKQKWRNYIKSKK
jgi:hypothetical protein